MDLSSSKMSFSDKLFLFSKNHGLHLILNDVTENGPAWESGVRPGDVIVTINDWLIVLMDRPQVDYFSQRTFKSNNSVYYSVRRSKQ